MQMFVQQNQQHQQVQQGTQQTAQMMGEMVRAAQAGLKGPGGVTRGFNDKVFSRLGKFDRAAGRSRRRDRRGVPGHRCPQAGDRGAQLCVHHLEVRYLRDREGVQGVSWRRACQRQNPPAPASALTSLMRAIAPGRVQHQRDLPQNMEELHVLLEALRKGHREYLSDK